MSARDHVLALDTATDVASVAIVETTRREAVAELEARPSALLARLDDLFDTARVEKTALGGVVVGVGPGRYTSLRIGLATAKAIATALKIPITGVSTLDALVAGAPGAVPLIDARRGEVFMHDGELVCVAPERVAVDGRLCVGDGAVAYRAELEARGATVPGESDPRHRVRAAFLAQGAGRTGLALPVEPLYLRAPDAERTRKEFPQA